MVHPAPGAPAHQTSKGLNQLILTVLYRQAQMSHDLLLSSVEFDTARPRFADGATAKRAAMAANRAGSGGRRPTLLIWYGKSSQRGMLFASAVTQDRSRSPTHRLLVSAK